MPPRSRFTSFGFILMSQTFSCSLYEMVVWLYEVSDHFFPNKVFIMIFPVFRSTPALEVGIPVALAILCLVCVMPNARFHEKLRPGMGDDFLLITYYVFKLINKPYSISSFSITLKDFIFIASFCLEISILLKLKNIG